MLFPHHFECLQLLALSVNLKEINARGVLADLELGDDVGDVFDLEEMPGVVVEKRLETVSGDGELVELQLKQILCRIGEYDGVEQDSGIDIVAHGVDLVCLLYSFGHLQLALLLRLDRNLADGVADTAFAVFAVSPGGDNRVLRHAVRPCCGNQ